MAKFKIGDEIIRVSKRFRGMCTGFTDTIASLDQDYRHVGLVTYGEGHSIGSLELHYEDGKSSTRKGKDN